jgi:diguanylate cyclase (GGDEF)-like protein
VLADAAKAGALLYAFGATLISLEIWVIPAPALPDRIWWVPVVLVPILVLLAIVMWRAPHRLPVLWWPSIAVLAVGVILFLSLVSHDPSASSQLAFCWPVLFASYHLRVGAARVVGVLVVAAEITLCVTIDPAPVVVEDAVGVSVILVALMVVLVHARERADLAIRALRHDAEHDAVTGLLSRRSFDADIDRVADETVSLIVVDIDDFKSVNDSFGHSVGDAVLRVVAACLEANGREHDSAYRLGGDELAVLLRGCPGDAALRRAEEIRVAVQAAAALRARVTVSLGVANFPDHARHAVDLLAIADAAMYAAKSAGRNRVVAASIAA